MKYFIDFEAQQYTNEIIEIGCVREDGCQFHSLVHPGEKHKKLSGFVKKLTGITQEELNNAPSVDEVFTRFFYSLLYHTKAIYSSFFHFLYYFIIYFPIYLLIY